MILAPLVLRISAIKKIGEPIGSVRRNQTLMYLYLRKKQLSLKIVRNREGWAFEVGHKHRSNGISSESSRDPEGEGGPGQLANAGQNWPRWLHNGPPRASSNGGQCEYLDELTPIGVRTVRIPVSSACGSVCEPTVLRRKMGELIMQIGHNVT